MRLALALPWGLLWTLAGGLDAADSVGLSVLLEARMAARRGTDLLYTHQRGDGSWAGDPTTTAQVLICLENAPGPADEARRTAARAQAVAYLRRSVAEATAAATDGAPAPAATVALAAALMALARDSVSTHRELLSRGRVRLLAVVEPLGRAGAVPEGAAASQELDASVACAVLDALLVTEGLDPAWSAEGYAGLTAYLRAALRAHAAAASLPVPALVRALLSLGASPTEPSLATPLSSLAQTPPRAPAEAFLAAEALSLVGADRASPELKQLDGWRDRLLEALLGSQQGDSGWPAAVGDVSRDRSTALALRALQVAAGRYLAEPDAASP